jgi:hypothetical protein
MASFASIIDLFICSCWRRPRSTAHRSQAQAVTSNESTEVRQARSYEVARRTDAALIRDLTHLERQAEQDRAFAVRLAGAAIDNGMGISFFKLFLISEL